MKILLLAGLGWLAPFFAPTVLAPSDELKRERLPADVDFVVHFDLEGFKHTELWRHVAESSNGLGNHVNLDDLDEFRERFGIDPLRDVRAVTLFKTRTEEDPTVVLFSTTPAIDEALRKFQSEPGHRLLVDSGIELHSWAEDDADADAVFAYVHAAPSQERVVILSSNRASAVRAARILRGEEPSHAQGGSLLTLAPARGSFLYLAAAEIPHLDEFTPASQVFGLAQGIQVDLGEAGGFLRGHMGVTTNSPEDALNISNVANGLVSLARLAGNELGEWMELLSGLRLNTRGSELTLDFEYGVQRLLQILDSLEDDEDHHADADEDAGRHEVKIRSRTRNK